LHLCQYGAAQKAIGIPECLNDLKVVIALAHEEPDRFAGNLHRCGLCHGVFLSTRIAAVTAL
jgi:hypothetical protein